MHDIYKHRGRVLLSGEASLPFSATVRADCKCTVTVRCYLRVREANAAWAPLITTDRDIIKRARRVMIRA